MPAPLSAVLVGAGSRGTFAYGQYAVTEGPVQEPLGDRPRPERAVLPESGAGEMAVEESAEPGPRILGGQNADADPAGAGRDGPAESPRRDVAAEEQRRLPGCRSGELDLSPLQEAPRDR